MKPLKINKTFTLIEPGPVVLVTTSDGVKSNIMTISWTTVVDFTPKLAITTGPWNFSYSALRKSRECVVNIECKVVEIVKRHDIVFLEGLVAYFDSSRREKRTIHAVGDGMFIVGGRKLIRKKMMQSKLLDIF